MATRLTIKRTVSKQNLSQVKSTTIVIWIEYSENVFHLFICVVERITNIYNHLLENFSAREIDVPLPEFVNPTLEVLHNNNTLSTTISTKSHLNYYYLNGKGRDAVKRILCVYEYHYPQVTHNPLLVSVASILLHYMQEHEVFAALCIMSASKDHFIESKSSWETSSAVFTKLLKTYCVSSGISDHHYLIPNIMF